MGQSSARREDAQEIEPETPSPSSPGTPETPALMNKPDAADSSNFPYDSGQRAPKYPPFLAPRLHSDDAEPGSSSVACSDVPPELLDIIATFFCTDVRCILTFSLVCRRFVEVVSSGHVWKSLFSDRFPLTKLENPEDPFSIREKFFALHESFGDLNRDNILLQGEIPNDPEGKKPMPSSPKCLLSESIFRLFGRIVRDEWLDEDEGGCIAILEPRELFEGKFVILVQRRSYFQYEEFEDWYALRWGDFFRAENEDEDDKDRLLVELDDVVFGPRLLQLAMDGILCQPKVFASIARLLFWREESLCESEVRSLKVYLTAEELPKGADAWFRQPAGVIPPKTTYGDEELIEVNRQPSKIGCEKVTIENPLVFQRGFYFDLREESSAACGAKDYRFGEGVLVVFADGRFMLDSQTLVTCEVQGIYYS